MSFDGLLNTKCSIQKRSLTQDAMGQETESWTTVYSNVRCRLDQGSGGVKNIPQYIFESVSHVLFMKIIKGFNFTTKDYRAVIGGENYSVLLIANAGGHNHHWQVLLNKVE